MNILHVSCIKADPCSGMTMVIPEHVRAQAMYEQIHLLNFTNDLIDLPSELLITKSEWRRIGFKGLIDKWGQPDLVIFHGIYLPELWMFYFKYVKGKYKYVVLPHGSMSEIAQKKSHLKKFIFNHLFVYNFTKKSNAVQFLSEAEHINADKKFYNYYIIKGNGISSQRKYCRSYNGETVRFVFVGRLDIVQKGLDLLVDACELLRTIIFDKQLNIKVDIYGPDISGSKGKLVNNIKISSLSSFVEVHNAVFGDDKEIVYLNHTTFFIMPSRFEGQPMSALEALSYGIPIIVTPGTGFADETNLYNCGYTTKDDPESIKNVILHAYYSIQGKDGMSRYKEMQNNALKCVSKYYWTNLAKDTLVAYSNIINEK